MPTMQAVEINVPEVSETVRSPTDALDFVTALLVALGTTVVVLIFPDVFGGLGVDLNEIFEEGSDAAAEITGLVLTAIALTVPLVLVVYFVWAREFRRLAIVVLAAVIGAIATALAIGLLSAILGSSIVTPERGTVVVAETAYYPYVAAITAAITAAAPWMPRLWRRVAWVSLAIVVVVRLLLAEPATDRAPDRLHTQKVRHRSGAYRRRQRRRARIHAILRGHDQRRPTVRQDAQYRRAERRHPVSPLSAFPFQEHRG